MSCSPPAGFTTRAGAPASVPVTTLHLPVSLPSGSTCTLTAYTQSGSKTSPKANKTVTTPAQAKVAPSLSNWNPNYAKQAGSIDVVAPQMVDCNSAGGIVEYTVGYKMSGASGAPATLSTKSPGTVTLPDNSVQYGIGQSLDITVVGECADGTKTPEGSSKMHVETCPTVTRCGTYSTSGTCACTACVPDATYVPSSAGYTCETRPNGSLAPNGITVVCPNAKVGDTFTIGGVMYTKRARKDVGGVLGLESLRDTDPAQLTTSCTTGVDDLSALFKVRFLACSLLRRCLVAACLLDLVSTLTPRAHMLLSEL